MNRHTCLAALLCMGIAASARAACLALTLTSGDKVQGEVITNSQQAIELRLSDGTTRIYKRTEIASIGMCSAAKKDPPAPAPAPTPSAPSSKSPADKSPAAKPATDKTTYVLIPIEGTIGEDAVPMGLDDALAQASKKGIRHAVIWVNSDGGLALAIDGFKEAIQRHDSMRIITVVQKAHSAAVPFVLLADDVLILDSARVGAAVGYLHNASTGEIDVDAKFNSALAADFATMAESKGRSAVWARAMVVRELEAWACKGDKPADTAFYATRDDALAACDQPVQLDGPATILTFTADELLQLGIASGTIAREADIGPLLGLTGWTKPSDAGAASMRKAAEQVRKQVAAIEAEAEALVKKLTASAELINGLEIDITAAQNLSPHNFTYFVDGTTGVFTPAGKRDWQTRTDQAIEAWNKVEQRVATIGKLEADCRGFIERPDDPQAYFLVSDTLSHLRAVVTAGSELLRSTGHNLGQLREIVATQIATLKRERERNGG